MMSQPFWKHIVSFASGYGSSHTDEKGKEAERGVKGMDRIVWLSRVTARLQARLPIIQCTGTYNKQDVYQVVSTCIDVAGRDHSRPAVASYDWRRLNLGM